MSVEILTGDCREVLAAMEPESFHACVCDPPYHLTSIVKRFGRAKSEREAFARTNPTTAYRSLSKGFMGKQWDGGDVAFRPETWAEVWRVLKPGGYLLAFGGTRTYHRLACAIEDAGFEIRDTIMWVYGSGFPKSHDVSKAIDRAAGAQRESVGPSPWNARKPNGSAGASSVGLNASPGAPDITAPATDAAREWSGWGTALKPACEPIVMARKPLSESTVAGNVLKHGCGALNVDVSRVGVAADDRHEYGVDGDEGDPSANTPCYGKRGRVAYEQHSKGRWPANLAHDGSPEVMDAFARFGESNSCGGKGDASRRTALGGDVYGDYSHATLGANAGGLGDTGTAARFFYCAKAGKADRCGSKHPTVKPIKLMEWLVRMVTPPSGRVIDLFCGTGSTLVAADRLGFDAVGIDADPQSVADASTKVQALCSPHAPRPLQAYLDL